MSLRILVYSDNARTRAFVRQLHWLRCEISAYTDAHHTLDFEPDPSLFHSDLVRWLDSVTAPPDAGACAPDRQQHTN